MIEGHVLPFRDKTPALGEGVFIAPGAFVIGDVEIGAGTSIWFNTVVRGDVHSIRIGARTNIQDGSVVHVTGGRFPVVVGDDVLIGHMVMLHGCTIESGAMVGMRATVLDDVVVEGGAMVAAGALVTPGKRVRKGEVWAGAPARHVRDMTDADAEVMRYAPPHYVELAETYRRMKD